ncbi:iron chelate uptake ABC transporter family permease subunit [Serratia proteamaculans]|uniref:iron chelate uptake ABC transporter family permease subunit n=1 Tax=Serratia proteamaculans TaxID=28151 RepID=UPI0039AEC6D3
MVTFFGLLVANLAYRFVGNARHALMLPASVLIAIICLVGGQFVLERLFGFNTSLSIVIEFLGGIAFIILIMQRMR